MQAPPRGKALRSPERLATRAYLESIGVPTLGEITPPGKMEGGDVLWIDEKTVARINALRAKGYDPAQVQAIVNGMLK